MNYQPDRAIKVFYDIDVNSLFDGIAEHANVQQHAASQFRLLAGYHQIELAQSRDSFRWALIGLWIGLAFFIAALLQQYTGSSLREWVSRNLGAG